MVAEGGENLGILETAEALRIARERGLDLIEISPTAKPPVCKIMDFGKFKYEREKGEREHSKKQKTVEVKGVRIGFTTGKHDLIRMAERVEEFLESGDKVRIDMVLHGREKAFRDMASEKFNEFMQLITKEFTYESEPKKTPQGFIAIIYKKTGA